MNQKTRLKKDTFLRNSLKTSRDFFITFFEQSAIHGFAYFAKMYLLRLERFLWLILIIVSIYFCTVLGLESWQRFQTGSTVVAIEKDHYYWNTSLPSLTICSNERISKLKFDKYCDDHSIVGDNKTEFFQFIVSLANSSYINFQNIKEYRSVAALNIHPEDYMMLIYNLTEDMTKREPDDIKVRTINNLEYIRVTQTLTEFGICYTTNNFISPNMSTKWILEGQQPEKNSFSDKEKTKKVYNVRFGNLFDGDITYSFIGFSEGFTTFLHSPYESMDIARNNRYSEEAIEFEAYSEEIIASDDFMRQTTIAQRRCRFTSESNLTHYNIYTKGVCRQECRLNLAYKLCGCIPHFYPNRIANPKRVCHYKELKNCFPDKRENLLELQVMNKAVVCNCLQNCVNSNIIVEKYQTLKGTEQLLGSIGGLIVVKKYPMIRYKRQILFTFTDLLVSIGGTFGLFLGFSVLGAVEIIYFFSLRLFWYIRGRN